MEVGFEVSPELRGRVRVGLLILEDLRVREADEGLAAEVDQACASFRGRYGEGRSSEVPGAADARALYKALGIDPTKTRPSNEALLRRALKGETLYRISTLVDALNLVSLREQLPFGLYDLDRVKPPVVLRKGNAGEGYEGIRKGVVNVEARPVLVDAEGPFGNPTSDSARTIDHASLPGARWSSPTPRPATASAGWTPSSTPRRRRSSASVAASRPGAPTGEIL